MILVLSGEGPSDLGTCTNALGKCSGDSFLLGPMTVIIAQMLALRLEYSLLDMPDCLYYFSKAALGEYLKSLPQRLQPTRGKKKDSETGYYFVNAAALGGLALALEQETHDKAIAVLFRDSDGTRSQANTDWDVKWQSMMDGFRYSQFSRGVPMLPKPKSEAWLICVSGAGSTNCADYENLSGNDDSPKSAKQMLDNLLGGHKTASELSDWLTTQPFDTARAATMPSFKLFHDEINRVLAEIIVNK